MPRPHPPTPRLTALLPFPQGQHLQGQHLRNQVLRPRPVQAEAISVEPPHPMGETAVVPDTPPPTNFSGLIDSAVESPAERLIAQPAAQVGPQTIHSTSRTCLVTRRRRQLNGPLVSSPT